MDDRLKAIFNRFGLTAFERTQKLFLKQDVAIAERRGAKLGGLLFRLDKKHRNRAIENLRLAFPEWEPSRHEAVARASFEHFGLVMGDFMRSPLRTKEEMLATTEMVGWEHYEAAVSADKGIIVCTAHLGNFERFGHYCTAIGKAITVVARDANQGDIQGKIADMRRHTGIEVFSRGNSARGILQCLRKKEMVGLLPDQNTDESFVPFFGHPCGTVLGPAVMHLRTGAPILPAFCVRTGVGHYRVILREPIGLDGSESEPEPIMARFNAVLESVIREYPDQYLWMHDRWKSARRKGLL